jgi:hypothetical protein
MAMQKGPGKPQKEEASFHPELDNLRHHKSPPSGAIVNGADEDDTDMRNLEAEDTDDLRERLRVLGIDGWETFSREELLSELRNYRLSRLAPRSSTAL